MDLSKFSRDDLIIGGLALLLAIDLLALPWFDISVFSVSVTSTGTGAPDGWLGVLAMLAALAVAADLALDRLGAAELPSIGGSRNTTRFALAAAAAVFVALKFLFHIHFNEFGLGFWFAVVLAGALVFLAFGAHAAGPSATPRPPRSTAPPRV